MPSKKHNDKYLNRRDIFGRDYSCILSSLRNIEMYDEIDPYSHDLENGYTPLHITLKQNQLKKAFKIYKIWKTEKAFPLNKQYSHILNEKDREGLSPIDLYNLQFQNKIRRYPKQFKYIYPHKPNELFIEWQPTEENLTFESTSSMMTLPKSIEEEKYLKENRGSHILTLGSNTNYQLGTGNKDDRQNFFQMHINQIKDMVFPPSNDKFKEIKMTKYHCIVRTTDDTVFSCGSSTRGRLGNGSTEKPSFNFSKILDFRESGIKSLQTSDNHSVLLDRDGNLFTWGWNAFNQLCYTTTNTTVRKHDEKNMDTLNSSIPRKVHFFDDKNVSLIACSPIHTCVLTNDNMLYMWGLNVGQMGSSKLSHISPDAEYMGEFGHIMTKPIVVNLSHLEIEQIVATEFVTFCRCKGNTLVVLSDHNMKTFRISVPHSKNYKEIDTFKHFAHRGIHNEAIDIKCSNPSGNNLCIRFSCGRVGIVSPKNDSINRWAKFSNNLPISLYWNPDRTMHNCLDFDVGSNGGLIVCTYGGEVFMANTFTEKFTKVHSSKLISGRAISVSCDSSFDSFAIIKDECNPIDLPFKGNDVRNNFKQYSPLNHSKRIPYESITYGEYYKEDQLMNEGTPGTKIFEHIIHNNIKQFAYDVEFVNNLEPASSWGCHKLILKRCKTLLKYLKETGSFNIKDGMLIFKLENKFTDNIWKISVSTSIDSEFVNETLKSVIHMLYTDENPKDQQIARISTHIVENSIHKMDITSTIHDLFDVYSDSDTSMESLNNNLSKTDVIIRLKEDEVCYGHAVVLSSRSMFFNIALNNHFKMDIENEKKCIELPHVSKDLFKPILRYLYGFPFENILDLEVLNKSFSETLNFLFELLMVTDELNLIPLKIYTESILSKYINGSTVVPILLHSVNNNASILQTNCCIFLALHIGILFCKENIELIDDYFDDHIWGRLESQLASFESDDPTLATHFSWYETNDLNWIDTFKCNIAKFNAIFMHGPHQFAPLFDQKPDLISSRRRSSTRRSSSSNKNAVRRSSVYKESRQSSNGSFSDTSQFPILLKNPWGSTTTLGSENSSAVEDDPSDFVEVVRKSKRKSVVDKKRKDSESLPTESPLPSAEILIHPEVSGTGNSLPSLLNTGIIDTKTEKEDTNAKISGTFKKNTQKQRKKLQLNSNPIIDNESGEKHVWGKSGINNDAGSKRAQSNGNEKLPSLFDATVNEIKSAPKRSKRKNIHKEEAKTMYSEFVSTGTGGGIKPYMVSTKQQVNEISSVFGDKSGEVVSSLEEQIAALEFEKWFAQESAKVQKTLKRKVSAGSDIKILYRDTENMPTLNGTSTGSTSKRKVRGNFRKKDRKSLAEIL
ncbi:similar to Kazachstania africana KAFR_0B03500 hypothetical protein [Maudiozyma saulgeensis]|uniref:BTB domain-containing protein n=1 Tax=Maudiozyma saulgeensis TaxID=1789683 RepID=A0A1X7R8Z0_9SACH|nr:similar to Kazachstania africana KAFR_0B03500 hypothetical protein [Kazachstania saulgeensis]